jgi:hypothetical protein
VNVPGDFPINANQQEAYRADVTATVNTLYYDDEIGAGGGVLRLQIEVYDWQGQAAHSIHDQIDGIRVFSPDLMGTESVEAAFADDSG